MLKKLALFLIAFFILSKLTDAATGRFRLTEFNDNVLPFASDASFEFPKLSEHELKNVLSQRFRYLDRGKQCLVFLSEDGKYALKFFTNRYQFRRKLLMMLPELPVVKEAIAHNEERLLAMRKSYLYAVSELPKEDVALLHFHPYATLKEVGKVRLVDWLGIEHEFDLDRAGFMIQAGGCRFFSMFEKLFAENREEKMKEALIELVALYIRRNALLIDQRDPPIFRNVGIVGENRPIFFDLGSFQRDPRLAERAALEENIQTVTNAVRDWLGEHGKQHLSSFLNAEIQRQIDEKFEASSS